MQWRDVAMPEPGEGELLIRQTAVGLNFIDVYHRSGLYPLKEYPSSLGMEAAGIVEKVGPNTQFGFKEGDLVAYGGGPVGAYTQYRALHERHVVLVPKGMSDQLAAGVMVKGLTAYYLIRRTFRVDNQTTMLVHAAAGGVGLLLCQWGKYLGARVIGTVSSEEKAEIARANGCEYPINYKTENFVERVQEITDGRGCNVVYDSVGKDTFMDSLDCLMPIGLMVSFGQASGPVGAIDPGELQRRGSLYLTRPSFQDYMQDHSEYVLAANELLQHVLDGVLKINVKQTYFLSDAASAHRDLESRKTTGATVMVVDE